MGGMKESQISAEIELLETETKKKWTRFAIWIWNLIAPLYPFFLLQATHLDELWGALRPVRLQGALLEGLWAKAQLLRPRRHQMGQVGVSYLSSVLILFPDILRYIGRSGLYETRCWSFHGLGYVLFLVNLVSITLVIGYFLPKKFKWSLPWRHVMMM